nr:hypothetical protein [Tanacetum cinerariifolium]
MDLFNLIRAPNPTKVKVESRPRAPHEVPLLTQTAPRVIEMDEPAATNSSGVPSTIERSPLDFAHEAEASDQGAAAPELPSSEDVHATVASGVGQAEETTTMDPPTAPESRKRGHDGTDVNAPPKSLLRDYADPQPSGSSRGGKSLAAIQLGLASTVVPEDALVGVSDPDPLSFADAPSRHPADVAQSSQGIAAAGDPGSENASSPAEVGLLDTPEACQDLVDHAAPPGYFSELRHMHNEEFLGQYNFNLARQVAMGSQLCLRNEEGRGRQECWADQRIRRPSCSVLRSPSGQRTFVSAGCYSSGVGVVSAGVAKGMSEGLKHEVEHGQAQLKVESIEAYDPEAEAKFVAALQSLKDLKYPLLDQLEGLKKAPMVVILAALYLESDTGEDAPQYIRDLRPSSSQLTILVYPEVRDPRNPWAYKEEMKLSDAIAANITHVEKKKKCRIVCRTHGVGSAHHARSDGVPVSVPTVVPQGLTLLLVDAATQTGLEDT